VNKSCQWRVVVVMEYYKFCVSVGVESIFIKRWNFTQTRFLKYFCFIRIVSIYVDVMLSHVIFLFFLFLLTHVSRSGLAIVAIRLWSQWPFQSPTQYVKKEAFWRNFGGLMDFFVWNVAVAFYPSQRPFDPSPPLHVSNTPRLIK
jgi:hypothetical protein